MLSRRSIFAFSLAERQALRYQWLRSGQCVRCFRASVQRRADGESNEDSTPYNAPQRGPTRQQRAAMVSEEVKMLQRDHPSPSFGEPDPNTLRPPGASKTVDPEAIGENVGSGRMGENDSPSQEGPMAQGLGRVVAVDEDVADTTGLARGVTTAHDAVEGPTEDSANVMRAGDEVTSETTRPREEDEGESEEMEDEEGDFDDHDKTWTQQTTLSANTGPLELGPIPKNELLHGPYSAATIAGGDFQGVIEDRIKTVADSDQQTGFRNPQILAKKLMNNQLVRFVSKEEKAAVEEAAKKIAVQRMQLRKWKKVSDGEVQPTPPTHKFAPLPDETRRFMIDKLVAGKYEQSGLLHGKDQHAHRALNEVSRTLRKNGTYLRKDGNRFLEKVQSLLPSTHPASTQSKESKSSPQGAKAAQ